MDQRMLAKKTSVISERLDQLEQMLQSIVSSVNNGINQLGNQVGGVTEVLDAVVQTLGVETIQKIMGENRVAKAEAQSAAEKAALNELLTKGDVKAVEKITEKSVVVGRETDKDGAVRMPGRAQVAFQRIDPNFQASFLGQGPGFLLDLPNGGKFEVQEVYEVVEKKDEPAPEALPVAETATTDQASP